MVIKMNAMVPSNAKHLFSGQPKGATYGFL
jgi:hypothetical protein